MWKRLLAALLSACLLLVVSGSALAQTYAFREPEQTTNVFWNEDGTMAIDYVFVFANENYASPIDYVDVGTPSGDFDINSIKADVNGQPVGDISASGYQGEGTGVAVGLGSLAIQPGATGRVHVFIGVVRNRLFIASNDKTYASGEFSPTYFGSKYVNGTTNMTVIFHLPPGVQPDEPRYYKAPNGFPDQPDTALDNGGRVQYTWNNPGASPSTRYVFGTSFPAKYVPASAVRQPSIFDIMGISAETCITWTFCLGFIGVIVAVVVASYRSTQKRKLQYLPPKISIEGHGIKRGLTAVETAILLEQPLDKVLTMILFGVLKKNAATVTNRDPLTLTVTDPLPEDLTDYEKDFLAAFQKKTKLEQRTALQAMMVNLVKSLSEKMKGFSRRETVAYYQDIMKRAWAQVEAAQTPEVKSQKFDEVLEWTMLDKDYDSHTQEVFHGGPVYVPVWWPRYSPGYGHTTTTAGPAAPAHTSSPAPYLSPGSLPQLPGSDFAASIVNGVQNFSGNVVGNLTEFTSAITNKTNPVPVVTTTSSGRSSSSGRSGGGCACACACACAGCACACAGGGR